MSLQPKLAYSERRDAMTRGLQHDSQTGFQMKARGSKDTREKPGLVSAVKKPELNENQDNAGLKRAQGSKQD